MTVKDREEREDIFTKKKPPVPMSTGEGIPMVVARQEDPLAAIRVIPWCSNVVYLLLLAT